MRLPRLRGFHAIAGAGALVLALIAAPGPSPAVAAKAKPAAPAKTGPGKAAPAPVMPITGPIDTQAKHALIIEAETGAVLLDKGAHERLPPASMSKVMTAYVVFGMLKEGRAKLDDELPVSEHAWRTQGSKMFVPIGSRIKIGDLLRGMIVQSGNDACVVLAEGLAGSEAAFVELMNRKAKEIGLTDSHFANVDGMPDPEHYMTAHDLATLALHTIKDFPEHYHYYSEKEYVFNNINQGNRNPLIYKDIGADGLKTGHTEEAGYSLLASVHRDKRRIVLVLGGLPTMKARAQESERLIEWAFREFNDYQLFAAGDKIDEAETWLGASTKVPLTVAQDLVVTMPRKSRKEMKVTLAFDKPVPAPVKKGDKLGKLIVTAPDIDPVEAPLVAANAVDRLGPLGRMAMVAGHMIWGNRR
jgi:serine-type D-Ala-D-Ala carboxypeptidase (penicillin-binding protein 5/6)